jgi:CHAT domain-containing protein
LHSLAIENEDQSPYFILGPAYDSLDSNRLHDYEINALSLTSPMVVLSSCESAGGNLQSGEGIKSLSRSFLLGGAESVVHTLWPLEDKKGKEVIIGYYEELKKGKSKSIALSMAKRQYLQSNPNATTHPYYWATFQVNGDPAPLGKRGRMLILSFMLIVLAWGSYFLIRRSFFSRD